MNAPTPRRRGPAPKYPFASLSLGDSFLVPADAIPAKGRADSIYLAGYQWAHARTDRAGIKFYAAEVADGGARVWCVARPDTAAAPEQVGTAFPVESGIPLPWEAVVRHERRTVPPEVDFGSLEVGEDMTVPRAVVPAVSLAEGVRALNRAAFAWIRADRSRTGRRFRVSKGFGGYLVERVA